MPTSLKDFERVVGFRLFGGHAGRLKDLTKLAKTLGPKGLMPNPKSGTVTFDIGAP